MVIKIIAFRNNFMKMIDREDNIDRILYDLSESSKFFILDGNEKLELIHLGQSRIDGFPIFRVTDDLKSPIKECKLFYGSNEIFYDDIELIRALEDNYKI